MSGKGASMPAVESTYRDFSHVSREEEIAISSLLQIDTRDKVAGTVPAQLAEDSFPLKLHYVLSELEGDGLSNVAGWAPNGRCFTVYRQHDFVEQVLRQWFRQTKYASFQRQLNIYGFKRITSGPYKNYYFHELFLRGKSFLALRLERTKIKGAGSRRSCPREKDPDFSKLPILPAGTEESRNDKDMQPTVQEKAVDESPAMDDIKTKAMLLAARSSFTHQLSFGTAIQAFAQNQMLERHRMASAYQAVNYANPACHVFTSSPAALRDQQNMLASVPPFASVSPRNLSHAMFLQLAANRRRMDTAAIAAAASAPVQRQQNQAMPNAAIQTGGRDKRKVMAALLDEALKF